MEHRSPLVVRVCAGRDATVEKMFGYRREELVGKPVEKLIPEGFRKTHVKHRAQFSAAARYAAHGCRPGTVWPLQGRREFSVEISLSGFETHQGTLVLSAVRDMSALKRAEEQLRQRAEE